MYSQVGADPLIGCLFAERYLINFLVARGGMGNIYQANDIKMGRIIAIKMLRPEFADDPLVLRRFERESDAISNLKHPNICQFYESGCTPDGTHYFTMEYLQGHALDALLKEQHVLPPEVAISYMIQVAEGLCDAHDKGIIHRDLKPANIFIVHEANSRDFIKVLDFGVAKINDDFNAIQEKLTRAGSTLGTPYYMSPEQIQGLEVDGRTDIYALGVILWECVFGEPVFKGKNLIEIFSAVSNNRVPKLPSCFRTDKLWQKLYEVLVKALQKERERRFSSMHAFQRALEDVLDVNSPVAHPLKTPRSLPVWKNIKHECSGLGEKISKLFRRISPLKLVLIGAVFCVCIGSVVATVVLILPNQVEVPKAQFETYKFYSDVPASVMLNGESIGKTPMSIDLTHEPPFTITLTAADYPEQSFRVEKKSENITGYAVNFVPRELDEPQITVETVPSGAVIYMNGQRIPEKSPCNIDIPVQKKEISIKVVRTDFQTEEFIVVPNGGNIRIKSNLFRQ